VADPGVVDGVSVVSVWNGRSIGMKSVGGLLASSGILVCMVVVVIGAGPSALAQSPYPVFTVDHFSSTMKTIGPNFASLNRALVDNDFDAAKERLVLVRQQLATTITFWRDHEKDDAVAFLRTAVSNVDALDDALSTVAVDSVEAMALAREIGSSCASCHEIYREQDSQTGDYRVRISAYDR